ncbi:MAG: class I SAM-dependent methyltransferase [Proteobacteria bacterium]|nr:class I SAM-dependent methyltransferase [Pseudomonadota bacterium]
MTDYLKTIYFREEMGINDYPQLMCNHIAKVCFGKNVNGKKILDIGCGKGNHLTGFSRCGMEAYGLDKRDECIESGRDFKVEYCDIENEPFPFEGNYFDYIFSKSVLEHVWNTDNFLQQSLHVLKPGGMAVFMTPDWRSQCSFFWDDYTHVKAFTRKSLQNAMIINGYSNVDCSYFLQLPVVWKYPWFEFVTKVIALLPECFKWKDKNESQHRALIRFSKEKMLLSTGKKPNG